MEHLVELNNQSLGDGKTLKQRRSFLYRYNHQIHILWTLDRCGTKLRTDFYWNKERSLQEGYVRVYNKATDKAIAELIRRGYIKES